MIAMNRIRLITCGMKKGPERGLFLWMENKS